MGVSVLGKLKAWSREVCAKGGRLDGFVLWTLIGPSIPSNEKYIAVYLSKYSALIIIIVAIMSIVLGCNVFSRYMFGSVVMISFGLSIFLREIAILRYFRIPVVELFCDKLSYRGIYSDTIYFIKYSDINKVYQRVFASRSPRNIIVILMKNNEYIDVDFTELSCDVVCICNFINSRVKS